ncbi:MAG: hypothetical protein IPK13_12685 [Deltaproteobacteria bacterium]|nr:hypothetical protein [Deltaproteobacteria bacterium]
MSRRGLFVSTGVSFFAFLSVPHGFAANLSIQTNVSVGSGSDWGEGGGSSSPGWPSAQDYSPAVNTDDVDQMDTVAPFRVQPDLIPGKYSAHLITVDVPVQADATIQTQAPGVATAEASAWGRGMAKTWRRERLGPLDGDLDDARQMGNERGSEVAAASSQAFNARGGDAEHRLVPQETGQIVAPIPGHDGGASGESESDLNGSDPVDPATGEFRRTSIDFMLSGVGLPVVFKRVYRSRWAYDGPLGHGWTHSFDERLLVSTAGRDAAAPTAECGPRTVRWFSGDGGSLEFRASATGWRSFPQTDFLLAEARDGGWTIVMPDGIRRRFDKRGLLFDVEDLNHNRLQYRWAYRRFDDGAGVSAVSEVTDTVGRRIVFSYDGAGYLQTVSVPSIGISLRYAVSSAGELVSVTNAAGVTERYVYLSAALAPESDFVPTPFARNHCESQCSTGGECSGIGETCEARLSEVTQACTNECFAPSACASSCNACEQACEGAPATGECSAACRPTCESDCLEPGPDKCHDAQSKAIARCDYDCTADARSVCENLFGCTFTSLEPVIKPDHQTWTDNKCVSVSDCERRGVIPSMAKYRDTVMYPNFIGPEEFEERCIHPLFGYAGPDHNSCISLGGSGVLGLGWNCRDECPNCYYWGGDCPRGSAARNRNCVADCETERGTLYPSLIAEYEKECRDSCGEACGQACAAGCETSCKEACTGACEDRGQCSSSCVARTGVLKEACDEACVDACEAGVAHSSGQVTFGRPMDLEHNLVEVYDGGGRLVLRNTYETSIFSPDFDRVVRQEYGDAVIEFHAYDLGLLQRERDAGRSVDAALIPPPELVDAEPASVGLCPQCGTAESIGAGPVNFHYVGVDPGDYLAIDLGRGNPREIDASGRSRNASETNSTRGAGSVASVAAGAATAANSTNAAKEMGALRWPVEGDVSPLEIYRWLEVHAEPSGSSDVSPARGRIYPLVSDEVGLSFATPLGRIQMRGVLGAVGVVSFEGSDPEALRGLSQGIDRPLVTLIRGPSGWGAYSGVVKSAMRLTPSDACSDEFSLVSAGSEAIELKSGVCRGAFAAVQLGRRAGSPSQRAFVSSEEPLSASADVREWAVDGGRLLLTRRSTVDAAADDSSWARSAPRSGLTSALGTAGAGDGVNPREVCFEATPILPEAGCRQGVSMLEVALRRSGGSGDFGFGGAGAVGGLGGGGSGADFDPNLIPGLGGGAADFELDPSLVPGFGPDVGPDHLPDIPPDLDPDVAAGGAPSVPDCGRPWLTRPSSSLVGHAGVGVVGGAGEGGSGGVGGGVAAGGGRLPPGFDPPTGSMDLTCVPIAIFEPGTYATPANLCPAPFGPARENANAAVQPMTHATIVRGGSGITWVHYADDQGRILRTVNVDAGTQTDRNLDAAGRLIGIRARDGSRTCQALDVHGLPRLVVDLPAPNEPVAQPALIRALHFGDHERLLSVSPANRREFFAHRLDERGNVAETLFEGDDFVAYSRDAHGRVDVVTTPRGRTRLTYDRTTGQPNHVTWAEGLPETHHKTVRYSGAGLPTEIAEPGRPSVRFEWQKDGRLAAAETDLDFGEGSHTVRTAYAYAADGSLAEVVGPETTTSYVTDVRGLVTSKTITDNTEHSTNTGNASTSRTWCFGYDGLGALIAEIDPEGRQTRLTRDAHGDVVLVERGTWLNASEAWATPCAANIAEAANAMGVVHEVFVRFERDASGRVVNEIFGGDYAQGLTAGGPGGRNRHLAYDGYGRLVSALAPNGAIERFGYDDESRMAWKASFRSGAPLPDGSSGEVERPDEHDPDLTSLTLYDYDAWNRPVEIRERWFVEDGSGGRLDLGDNGWRVWRASYDDAAGRTSERGPDGTITERETDARGRLVSVVERSADAAVTYRYDWSSDGRRLTYTVSPAATASGEYQQTSFFSPLGAPARLEDSTGEVLSWTGFDALGRPKERGDRSSTQFFEYNAFGEVVSIDRMDGAGAREPYLSIERTETGTERAVTDGLGHTWAYAYDAASRLTSVIHPDGTNTLLSYFAGSEDVRRATDRSGNLTTFEYDAWGNVRKKLATAAIGGVASGSNVSSSASGARRRNREVRYVYDTLGLREATALNDPTDPRDDVRLTYVRDSLGRIVSELDAQFGDALHFERDAMGYPTNIAFGNEAWSRAYDAWGRLTQVTARGHRSGAAGGNRPGQGSGQTTKVAAFEYEGVGQPFAVHFGSGATETRTFDEEGRLLTGTLMPSSSPQSQPVYQHSLYYGTDGHLVRFDQHIAGRTPYSQLFTSDALGRLEGASGYVTGLPAMVSGEISSETLRPYHSDPRTQPVPVPVPGAGTSLGLGSSASSPLGAGSGSEPASSVGSIARWVPESSRFTYDAADNFLTVETSAGVMSPSVGADNRYTTFAGLSVGAEDVGMAGVGLEMDDLESGADGRLTHLGVITFTYDALGNMVARTDDRDGASWQFRYDALGRLAGGIDSRGHAFALRRADGWIVEHRDLETGASPTYIPGLEPNTAPLAVVSADGRLVYNHAPWGERVMLTTDDRGRVASSYAWSAYGEPSSTSALSSLSPVESGANDLLLLGGQPYFAELGLHRFGQRWYAPGLGRFLSQDPLGFLDGANRYLYAGGQPIDFYDPLGLERQRVQRERSRAFMWALRGEQGLRDWDTSRAWGHELMQRHAGDAEYYRRHGHYPGLNPKASVQILKAMVMFPFAVAALASAPLQFAVALGFGEGASSGTGVVLDYAGVENEVVRALIQDTASVAAGSVAFGAAGRLGRTTMTTAEVAGSAASTEAVAPTAASAAGGATRITSGSQVTEQVIRDAMRGAPLQSQQSTGVSLRLVQQYVDRLLAGEVAPAIKVEGQIIVDGNHRYIAGRILGQEPAIQPWAGGRGPVVPWEQIRVSTEW